MMKYTCIQLRKSSLFATEAFLKYQVPYSFKAASLFDVKNSLKKHTNKKTHKTTTNTQTKQQTKTKANKQTKPKSEGEITILNTLSFKTLTIPTRIIEQLTRLFVAYCDQSTVKANIFEFYFSSEKLVYSK